MANFTLDDIRAAAEKKYGDLTIEVDGTDVVLVNALRLPKEKREVLSTLDKRLASADEETEDVLREALLLVGKDAKATAKLIDAIGDDMSALLQVFASYNGETELGEA